MATTLPVFEQAMEQVFSKWTLLALAVDQGWGGRDSRQKRQQLSGEVLERLMHGAKRRRPMTHENEDDVQDLADFIYERLVQLFHCETEDNSDEEVAYVCLKLFATCSRGDVSFAQEILAQTAAASVDVSKSKGVDCIQYATEEDRLVDTMDCMDIDEGGEGSTDGEDAMEEGKEAKVPVAMACGLGAASIAPAAASGPEVAGPPASGPKHEPPAVDEEGFMTVTRHGRRR